MTYRDKIFINGKEVTAHIIDVEITPGIWTRSADEISLFKNSSEITWTAPSLNSNKIYVQLHTCEPETFPTYDWKLEICGDAMVDAQGFEHTCTREKGHSLDYKHHNGYATWGTFEVGEKSQEAKELSVKHHPSNPYREYM